MDGDKQNARHFRRNKKGNDQTPDKDGQANQPAQEAPLSFHAHALDLEPGTLIPERASVDLTYHDFTRDSYEAGDKPFVPKRKKPIPFELSETPHTQSEYWEGKSAGRRRPSAQGENAPSAPRREEAQHAQETKDSDKQKQKQKPPKGKILRNVLARGKDEIKPPRNEETDADAGTTAVLRKDETQKAQGKGRGNKRQDSVRRKERGESGSGAVSGSISGGTGNKAKKDEQKALPPESAKESLMRPYWMKK